jgi:Na+-driven multidrug efflux pump
MTELPPEPDPAVRDSDRTVFRELLRLGVPLVAGMGGHALFNIVDLAMVGAYTGDEAPGNVADTLAAVGIASVVTTIPMVFMNGICNGTVTVIARHFAAGNPRRANQCARQAMLLAGFLSIVLGVVPALFAEQIATAFDMAPGTYAHALTADFLYVMSINAWSGFLLMQVTANMRAIGMSVSTMALLLASNFGNILGNYLLVFGEWGLPEMGPMGSAWATAIARGGACIAGIAISTRAHPAIRLTLWGWKPRARFTWAITRASFPVALQWTVRMIAITAVLLVISREPFDEREQAAYSVGTRLDTLALFAGLGWGAACAALVSHGVGRGAVPLIRKITAHTAVLNVLMMSIAGAVYWVFAGPLIKLFSLGEGKQLSPEDLKAAITYLRVSVFSYPALALSVVWSHALNGAGSFKTPLLLDTLGLLAVQVPLAWWLSSTSLGVLGAWWALVISHSLLALVYYLVFRRGAWEKKAAR